MKKVFLSMLFAFIVNSFVFSQPWIESLPKGKSENELTLFDYQKAFNDYWKPYNIDKGWYIDKNGKKQKAYGWKQFKRWEYMWQSRVNPTTGEFPKTSASEEFKKYVATHGEFKTSKSNWINLGTNSSTGGYAGIGRINIISFHPTNEDIFWIGAPAGGLWATTDGGNTWTVKTDNEDVLGVSSIIIPSDYETSHTIYIGTGDRDGGDNPSVGVLKSTDSGNTWNYTGLVYTPSQNKKVFSMLLHPSDDQTIFASCSDGFYKTINGGTNWTLLDNVSLIDIEFCPTNVDIIYGATTNGRIYKSANGGDTWTQVYISGQNNRIAIAVSPNTPNVVYAVVSNSSSGLYGIYKSTDYGDNFSLTFNSFNLLGWNSDGSDSGGQSWYDLPMAADPNNGNIVFVGGVNTWRSTDGGVNWQIVNHWTGSGGAQAVHADKHCQVFRHNESVLFEGNDGGIYTTSNNGTNWTDLTNGIVISQMYRLSVSQNTSTDVINGLQDNGTKLYSGGTWSDVGGGDGMECLIDYANANTQYLSIYYGLIERTFNHWASRVNISDNIPGGASGNWVTPYIIHPTDHNTIYVGMSQLWKSVNQGNSFTSIGTFGSNLDALAISPSNPDVIFAATGNNIQKTIDGGNVWTNITSGLPVSSASITYISVKDNDPNMIWVSMSGYNPYGVYQSTNGGNTWTNISSGLPSIPVNCVIQNKIETAQIQLYAATDFGVYIKNGDEDWTLYSTNLPNVVVRELEIYYDYNTPTNSRIRACTFGRGLWESILDLSGNYAPMVATGAASNITTGSADVNGTITNNMGSSVTESGIIYSTEPDPLIGGTGVIKVQTNPLVTTGAFSISLSALNSGEKYYFRAYAINGNGTGYGGTFTFDTQCETITSFAWTEDIENNGFFPLCFSQETVIGSVQWSVETGNGSGSPVSAHSGSYNMLMKETSLNNYISRLILPVMDISGLNVPGIKFWHTQPPFFSYQDELTVMYKNNISGSWNQIATYTEGISSWTQESIALPNPSSTYYIAFEGSTNGGRGICIDDLMVDDLSDINELIKNDIKIFPNPSNGLIQVVSNKFNKNTKLEVMDLTGKLIHKQNLSERQNSINLSYLNTGIYILKIKLDDTIIYDRILIE